MKGRPSPRPGRLVLRTPRETVAVRLDLRTLWVGLALVAAIAAVAVLTVTTVGAALTPGGALDAVTGGGTARDRFVLTELRLPRIVLGTLVGAGFAMSGAVFQSLSRNPLGSPDIVGFTQGSAAGALAAILFFSATGPRGVAAGAVVGGLATALLVYGLASVHSGHIERLVLIGIGVTAMLLAANNFLLSRARLDVAQAVAVWITGTLNGRTWEQARIAGAALAVLFPLLVVLGRRLPMLEMGADTAQALGLRVGRTRVWLVFLAVLACSVSTAVAGPIAFVALAAPQIARRLTGAPALQLVPAALTGALLVLVSDYAAQRAFAPAQVPVGVVTGAVGGVYLAWLLAQEWKKGRV